MITETTLVNQSVKEAALFYGPKAFPSEGHLQAACFQWWNKYFRTRSMLYAIPNGGTRNVVEVLGMKAQGLRPGVADFHLLLPGASLALIELKNGPRKLDPEQVLFKAKAEAMGFSYYQVNNFHEFAGLLLTLFQARPEDCP